MRMKTDDKDGDGHVTWNEYLETTYGMDESELEDYRKEDMEDEDSRRVMDKVRSV